MRPTLIPDSKNKIEVSSSLILFLLDCLETQKVCSSLGKTNKLYCIQPFEHQTANTHIWQQKIKKTERGIMDVRRMITHSRPKFRISPADQRLVYCRFMWLVTGCLYQRKLFFLSYSDSSENLLFVVIKSEKLELLNRHYFSKLPGLNSSLLNPSTSPKREITWKFKGFKQ